MIVKQDTLGQSLTVDPLTSLVRVDNITVCKLVIRCGVPCLQFKDKDRLRSQCRGTEFIEIPLSAFRAAILSAKSEELEWPYNLVN